MANIYESLAVKFPLQSLGMIQNSIIWQVIFPYIPMIGPAPEITYLATNTSIPSIKTQTSLIKIMGGTEFTVPNRKEYPHDWSVTLWMPEVDVYYTKMKLWYELQDVFEINLLKTSIIINLLSLNRKVVTRYAQLNGAYPLNLPGVEDLKYEETNGLIKSDFAFSFDNMVTF